MNGWEALVLIVELTLAFGLAAWFLYLVFR